MLVLIFDTSRRKKKGKGRKPVRRFKLRKAIMAGRHLRIQRLRLEQLVERFVFDLSIYIRLMLALIFDRSRRIRKGKGRKPVQRFKLRKGIIARYLRRQQEKSQ
jgi:hypothetical protein